MSLTIIISAGRSNESTRLTLRKNLVDELAGRTGIAVATMPHLYDLTADGPGTRYLQSVPGDMVVLASLYPRAAYWVLDANGIKGRLGRTSFFDEEDAEAEPTGSAEGTAEMRDRKIWCLDTRPHEDARTLLEEIERIVAGSIGEPPDASGDGEATGVEKPVCVEETTQYRWYPVVNYGRCANCLECMNFCLFGVFGVDESGQLMVEQPDACRDGCPACSRVCPSQAIMFPHNNSPAVAGDHTAAAVEYNPGLVQLFGLGNPLDLAATERNRALQETGTVDGVSQEASGDTFPAGRPAAKDYLDELADDLDKMDL